MQFGGQQTVMVPSSELVEGTRFINHCYPILLLLLPTGIVSLSGVGWPWLTTQDSLWCY